jgi:hypothetical protein
MRRPWLAIGVVVLVASATAGALVLSRDREAVTAAPVNELRADGLTLLVVRTKTGPFGAVIGSTGSEDGALVVPMQAVVTIPGQGEGTVGEALGLPPRQAATAVANLLGVWIDHYAVVGPGRLREAVDRAGGIPVGGDVVDGDGVVSLLEDAGDGATSAFQLVVGGLLSGEMTWRETDLVDADEPSAALRSLDAAEGAQVGAVQVFEPADGVFRADPDELRRSLVDVFGGPDRQVVDVIVLNGSGVPGVGELVAERIVPDGFRVVLSDNAQTFDHRETLIVVGSADDVALAERVRDLLGSGSVNVSVPSGIAPITIVVGKDFAG